MSLRYDFETLGPAHRQVVSFVGAGRDVLELGCATGYMTRALAEAGCRVTAVDVDQEALSRAEPVASRVLCLDLDREPLPADLRCDVAVCADVLEHLRDPEDVLRQVGQLLNPGGRVVVSLPNIAFWRIRLSLLRGRFDYEETGILDRTHVRFFTWKSAHELAAHAGLRVVEARGVSEAFPGAWLLKTPLAPLKHKVDGLLHRLLPRLFAYQWVMALEPAGRG